MELIRALGDLAEAPGAEQVRTARLLELPGEPVRSEYTDLFVVQLYPYASVYLSTDGQLGGQVQQHIADYWRVLRRPEPRDPDHVATLLTAYSELTHRSREGPLAQQELARQMRHAFLWEHLISWLLPFATRVRELGSPVYRAWGALLLDALEAEATSVGPTAVLPLHLRAAPVLPADGAGALADALFAPARCGVTLTRADLTRCARDLGLNTRVADRRYTLRSLIGQEPVRVCAWLAAEARRQAENLSHTAPAFSMVAEHWRSRALETAQVITSATLRQIEATT